MKISTIVMQMSSSKAFRNVVKIKMKVRPDDFELLLTACCVSATVGGR
jgi:hypothetical protein